jgi:hypothetical protein
MLTQLEERIAWAAAVLVMALCLVIGLEHRGAQKCLAADAKLDHAAEVHNTAVEAVNTEIIEQEARAYADALSQPVRHPINVSLCDRSAPGRPVRRPEAAPGRVDATAGIREPDHATSVSDQTVGPELQAVGRDADAQVAGLQDYIRRVCPSR